MPPQTTNFDSVKKEIDSILSAAESRLMNAKHTEHDIRLRISRLNRQHVQAKEDLSIAEASKNAAQLESSTIIAELEDNIAAKKASIEFLQEEEDQARKTLASVNGEVDRIQKVIYNYTEQRKTIEADIERLKLEFESLQADLTEARAAKDRTLNNLSAEIAKRSGELQAFETQQETLEVEHNRRVDALTAQEKTLNSSITELRAEESALLTKNSAIQQEIAEREAEAINITANLQRHENDISARERAVKIKEQAIATQLRRNRG